MSNNFEPFIDHVDDDDDELFKWFALSLTSIVLLPPTDQCLVHTLPILSKTAIAAKLAVAMPMSPPGPHISKSRSENFAISIKVIIKPCCDILSSSSWTTQ